jgi:hypothetical protein
MPRDPHLARQAWQRLEVIHAVTYFSPEPIGALRDAGYRGFWMGYFAGRAAPLGPASPEIVMATFYNFAESRVRKAIPDAWSLAPPAAALAARLNGSVATLRRMIGDIDVAAVAELARRAAVAAPVAGRTLFAANAALPWPDDPLAELWHAATLLREHRGDGHVAALTAAGVAGREANVLHFTFVDAPREMRVVGRDYDDAEWDANVAALAERGLVTGDGDLTDAGRALKHEIEARTDDVALSAYAALDDAELAALIDGLDPVAKAVVASGELPAVTPIGRITSA